MDDFYNPTMMRVLLAFLLVTFSVRPMLAQQESATTTLHAYANLIQIPVLVLAADWGTHQPVPEDRFRVSVDGGSPTHPKHVRREGDDPIDLSVLLAPVDLDEQSIADMERAFLQITPGFLKEQDRVSVYSMGCELFRSSLHDPVDEARLERQVTTALNAAAMARRNTAHRSCRSKALLDSLAYMVNDLATSQARRVILAITDGRDSDSRHKWGEVKQFAQENGVAIFGFRNQSVGENHVTSHSLGGEDLFSTMCQLTGGIVMSNDMRLLPLQLQHFTEMLRDRYIVEFARSNRAQGGSHSLLISVGDTHAIVRPTGIAVPLSAPDILADPNTVPSTDSSAPEPGERKTLSTGR